MENGLNVLNQSYILPRFTYIVFRFCVSCLGVYPVWVDPDDTPFLDRLIVCRKPGEGYYCLHPTPSNSHPNPTRNGLLRSEPQLWNLKPDSTPRGKLLNHVL